MTRIPLTLGTLEIDAHPVWRSGIQWLCDDGHSCRAGDYLAYTYITLASEPGAPSLFPNELADLQVVFVAPAAGIVRRHDEGSYGGFLDRLSFFQWKPDLCFGSIEGDGDAPDGDQPIVMLAGRRLTQIAYQHQGLLTGWHSRARGWWGMDGSDPGTLLAMGTCDLRVLQGDRSGFQELYRSVAGPVQLVVSQDEPLMLCARVVLEQLERKPADFAAIAADAARGLADSPQPPGPQDWLFVGALLDALSHSPLTDPAPVLSRRRLIETDPPQALLMTLISEGGRVLRHRRLGYTIALQPYRMRTLGESLRHWLRTSFEPVARPPAAIAADFERLLDALAARGLARPFVMNLVTTQRSERIHSYAAFPGPLAEAVGSVRAMELNLMLEDLARSRGLGVVDVDAIVAEFGLTHAPDGLHASAAMQDAIRSELILQLAEKGIKGFSESSEAEFRDPRRDGRGIGGQGLVATVRE